MLQPLLDDGRKLYDAQAWMEALTAFERAERDAPLPAADLTRYAFSAYLIGREQQCIDLLGRAFRGFLSENDGAAAARTAFWLAATHGTRRDAARSEAWGRRMAGIVDDEGLDAERALVAAGLSRLALESSDPADVRRALDLSREAIAIARPAKDTDTEVLSRLNAGWALLRLGSTSEGLAELDEAMAAVTSGEVQIPLVNGIAYCSVISASLQASDVARARDWTTAATDWCARYPDLVPFRGVCLVHRSVVKMLDGDWQGALDEAVTASKRLLPIDTGLARYQLGELHRLAGRFTEAEDAYRLANAAGRRPEPGLMLLRLAQGRIDAAAVSARRLNSELSLPGERAEFLPAYVEVMSAARDAEAATAGAEELTRLAESSASPFPKALALTAVGAALCAAGEAATAVATLREASLAWHDLGMPYPEARTRAALGRCYAALEDDDAAALEVEAARATFERLGAAPDLAALPGHAPSSSGPLTARELDVVRLVAKGLTNRAVAEELVLSEKTVARHLANIYTKLGVASRAAATAYAYDHGIVERA
ncbi:helix-turn-helix transcriptional regulator [Sinomonas sp. ASV322]|uniref:helix-turn-helix transcriptional regulator n=1 Tax=Sinomonas sp. ASV322 TaxID=3041920 RepID=UPI0027DB9FFC|nr:helix-turn-helix transcriptional regulator [Sinomonas sp. ASV322]MDQ4503143.1 helix-turn-helix transcriptional regulator [Sinomonas sp. ASV322]